MVASSHTRITTPRVQRAARSSKRDHLVDDQVGLFAAGPLVDRAANHEDGVGLDQLAVMDELLGPDDAADHARPCLPGRTWRSGWGLPGLGFFVCENLIAESMPPSITSVRCLSSAASTVVCEQ